MNMNGFNMIPPGEWGFAPEASAFAVLLALLGVAWMLRGLSRGQWAALLGSMAVGAVLRVWLAPATLMDMSNYERQPIVFAWAALAGFPIDALYPDGFDRWQQVMAFHLVVSCLLPLVVFAHGIACFSDHRVSLVAAALFAACPIPIYFARSDNIYVTSALLSSLTFILLHVAVTSKARGREVAGGLAAWVLFSVTLFARQENFLFAGLAAIVVVQALLRGGADRFRRVLWPLGVVVLGVRQFWNVTAAQASGGDASLWESLTHVLQIWPRDGLLHLAWTNNYLAKPWLLPLAYTLLALVGLVVAFRERRERFVYVAGWFLIFYLGHGVVWAWDDTASARYAMHTIIPVTFAAAIGAVHLFDRVKPQTRSPPGLALAGVAVVATWVLGFGLFRQPESDVQREYRFLRELSRRGLPEAGAVVIESYGHYDFLIRDDSVGLFAIKARNRFSYFGRRVQGSESVEVVKSARTFVEGHAGPTYLYLGLPCLWTRRGADRSPGCREALGWARWEKVAAIPVNERRHDNANGEAPDGGEIALLRLVGPPPSPVPPAFEEAAPSDVRLNPVNR